MVPIPVYWQTDFTLKWVVISRLHDTLVRFCTGGKFSLQYNNQGELTPWWLTSAWILYWYHVNKYRAMRGNWSELVLARKLPRCHVNTPLMTHCQPSYTFKGFQSKRLYTLFNTEAQWGTQQIFIRGGSARGPILTILYLSTVPFFTKKVPLS